MKILFFGTPQYVVPILEALHKQYNKGRDRELIGVVTQPPMPVGRTKQLQYSEVDHFAHKHKIDIYHSTDELPDADLGVCAAYGKIIPQHVIQRFTHGILNVHPSLLPKYRGASPIQSAIAMGDTETGVTIIKMDELMDHGPIVSAFKDTISEEDTNETVRARLFEKTAPFLISLIPSYLSGKIQLKPQDEGNVLVTKIITRDNGYVPGKVIYALINGEECEDSISIDFIRNLRIIPEAELICNLVRALSPWPGIWTTIKTAPESKEKRLKILSVSRNENVLTLERVQLEGKNPVTWEQFTQGYPEASFK